MTNLGLDLPGDTVTVGLVFKCRVAPGLMAELIDRIEIQTETPEGEVFFATTIDAELIPWSPNRAAPLPRDALSRDRRAGVRRAHACSRDE